MKKDEMKEWEKACREFVAAWIKILPSKLQKKESETAEKNISAIMKHVK